MIRPISKIIQNIYTLEIKTVFILDEVDGWCCQVVPSYTYNSRHITLIFYIELDKILEFNFFRLY